MCNELRENCDFIRKPGTNVPVFRQGAIPYLTFPSLENTGVVRNIFTTREGGVSGKDPEKTYLASMNLSFTRGDDDKNVRENFRRVARELGVTEDRFVFTDQTHTANVREATEADAGKGMTRPRDYRDIDGLVTNIPGLVLSVFAADCVPVALVDPVRRAIGLVHSGWRGTAGRISRAAIGKMHDLYGTDPADLVCAVGPSICGDCYEISGDVAKIFREEFPGHADEILRDDHNGHFHLDLWKTNRIILQDAGVRDENISVTGICTSCNAGRLFSHRASHGMRGNMGAFLMLKEN